MLFFNLLLHALFPWRSCGLTAEDNTEEAFVPVRQDSPNLCPLECEPSFSTSPSSDEDLIFHIDVQSRTEDNMTLDVSLQQEIESLLETEDIYLQELRSVVDRFEEKSIDDLAKHLVARNYTVLKRTVNYPRALSMVRLRNTFLVVLRKKEMPNVWEGQFEEILIEPRFRGHFIIGFDQSYYKRFLDILPRSFVASEDVFRQLVMISATEMEKAFIRENELVPLWRSYKAVLSKWFSEVTQDEETILTSNKAWMHVPGERNSACQSLHKSSSVLLLGTATNISNFAN